MDFKPWIHYMSLLILLPLWATAQNYYHIGLEDGLNERSGSQAFMDQNGLMWLTTASGIHTYDGYKIKLINTRANGAGDRFSNMIEDLDGDIWYYRSTALVEIDLHTHKVTEHFIQEPLRCFFIDYDGTPVIINDKNVFLSYEKGTWTKNNKWNDITINNPDYYKITIQKIGNNAYIINEGPYDKILLDANHKIIRTFGPEHFQVDQSIALSGATIHIDKSGAFWAKLPEYGLTQW
ncbi:MAG: hypothetical protein HKN09_02520, partial [Saprospiraceae bacterium]|nr:hypothetical protein [Saprospiraceae bacterium]